MRVSVTLFDTFQNYLDSENTALKYWGDSDNFNEMLSELEAKNKQAVIDSLSRIPFENAAMRKGTAFHTLVTEPHRHITNEFNFDLDFIKQFKAQIPEDILIEFKQVKEFKGFTITGKADFITLLFIGELKTTSKFDYDRYRNSWQWRFYLWLFGMDKLTYYVTVLNKKNGTINGKIIEPFSFYSYPNLESDLIEILDKLIYFINQNQHDLPNHQIV